MLFYLSEIYFSPVPSFFQFTIATQTWSTSCTHINFSFMASASLIQNPSSFRVGTWSYPSAEPSSRQLCSHVPLRPLSCQLWYPRERLRFPKWFTTPAHPPSPFPISVRTAAEQPLHTQTYGQKRTACCSLISVTSHGYSSDGLFNLSNSISPMVEREMETLFTYQNMEFTVVCFACHSCRHH